MRRRRRHLGMLLLTLLQLATGSIIDWKINEGLDEGEIIFNIPQEIRLTKAHADYTFKIVPENPYLRVNDQSSSGVVLETGRKKIDREEICPTVFKSGEKCIMNDYAILAMNGRVETHRLRLELLDINDNNPVFPHDNISMDISENAIIGQPIRLESATDRDPDFGIVSYQLSGNKKVFELKEEYNQDGTIIPSLILQSHLDREKTAQYQLVLSAFDVNSNSASANVTINVLDVNDNAPYFVRPESGGLGADETPSIQVSIEEDAKIGDLVYKVEANDKDTTSQGDISYEFHTANNDLVTQAFAIDSKTGAISVAGALDFDQTTRHNIYVIASDGEHQIHCTITVNILDTNDQSPVIMISYIYGDGDMANKTVSFLENITVETPLFYVSVSDSDPGVSGQVATTINDNEFFRMDKQENEDASDNTEQYIIFTRREFDRELKDTFELIIYAHDNGEPQLASKSMITISLDDVNDNVPMFRSPTYQKTLAESDPRGTVVFTLSDKVKDDDYGENGEFSFTLVDNADGIFRLVNNEIILDRMLDIDGESAKSDEFTLEVRVRDHGDDPKASSAQFKVKIGDINDSKPTFTKSHYSFKLSEIESQDEINVHVGQIFATDLDRTEENKQVIYEIKPYTAPNQLVNFPFELDLDTGEIRTNRTLDRDEPNINFKWDFSVTARNPVDLLGHTDELSEAQVTIELIDENDHKPTIERMITASGQTYQGANLTQQVTVIHYNPKPHARIIRNIQSADGDVIVQNKKILYSLDEADSTPFNLDSTTGQLTYTGDESEYGCHALTVIVRNEEVLHETLQNDGDWYQQKINVYFARNAENVTDIDKLLSSCQGGSLFGVKFADIQLTMIAIFIGVAVVVLIIIVILIVKCRWKKKKSAPHAKRTKSGHLLSSTTQDGTLDSRNDFEGDWTRPQLGQGMSPQHYQHNQPHQHHHHHPGDPGNHSFTSKDSGTGDSVPTENHQLIGSPEAMRFASDQHKIGYGDESWATTSMLRIQSQKQQPTVQGHLPQPQHEAEFNIPRTTSESPYSHPPQSPPSHEHGSPLPPPPAPQQQQQQYNHYGSYRRSAKPTFSTFVDNQSETSSMSAALINGHMSPDFDRLPSSANNTLERRAGYSDYGELGPPTIPEDRQSNQRFA